MRAAALIFSYVYNALPGQAAFENGLRSFWVFLFILLLRFAGHFPAQHNEACRNGGADEKKCESDHIHCLLRMFYAVYQYLRSRFRYCTASRTCSASMRSLPARSAMVRLTFSTLS